MIGLKSILRTRRERRPIIGLMMFAAVLVFAVLPVTPREIPAAEPRRRTVSGRLALLQRQHQRLHERFVADLEEIARYCDQQTLSEEAAQIRRLAIPVSSQLLTIQELPKTVQPAIPASLPEDEKKWRRRLRHVRQSYASDLYLLSRRVLHSGYSSYAYRLVREVARQDPNHKSARRLLGQVRLGNEWVTPFAARMIRRNYVWHEKYGWLRKSDIPRYDNGERYENGRWISADKAREIHRDFDNAWQIRTAHYLVKTNDSLEQGVTIAAALERYYNIFFQTFAGFFHTREQLQRLFEGRKSQSRSREGVRPYVVNYFRQREEYNRRLQKKIPQIAITNGLYYPRDRIAYFFHDPKGNNKATLYHEATHQLFYESSGRNRPIAERRDFWIIEGIACYMESFQVEQGKLSLGDPRYIRFRAARYRYLVDHYYVPLARFSAMGLREFQTSAHISKNYSQASGLAHFFMNYDGGRYRDALIAHLSGLYSTNPRERAAVRSLSSLTGVSNAELDRQYGRYLADQQQALKRPSDKPTGTSRENTP